MSEQSQMQPPPKSLWQKCTQGLPKFQRKRVPELIQMGATECGVACLTMILNYI